MSRETILNIAILAGLFATALGAHLSGHPFLVTLATKAAILGLAGTGLNLALGYGGLVSFGHAAFFARAPRQAQGRLGVGVGAGQVAQGQGEGTGPAQGPRPHRCRRARAGREGPL